MTHLIEPPHTADASAIGQIQLEAWLQTYPNEQAEIDETWIRDHRGSAATAEGIAQWREFIEETKRKPDRLFCRVVRTTAGIVGFMCGRRDDVVTLGPMYLLNEAQGHGTGSRLMREFLAWAGDTPMRLWVTAYNERAIRFYERYGFKPTGEQELWKGKLPNIRMARNTTCP
jgi:GNAT superfamily N-acetyltransferase